MCSFYISVLIRATDGVGSTKKSLDDSYFMSYGMVGCKRQVFICVRLLTKTVVDNVPLELFFTVVSRKESSPLDSNSTVKLMVSSIEFRWF